MQEYLLVFCVDSLIFKWRVNDVIHYCRQIPMEAVVHCNLFFFSKVTLALHFLGGRLLLLGA